MDCQRITVLTPCFNGGRYLERAMCSVLDQGYEHLEYAVADGGSCDGSTEVIRRYEDDLAWWLSVDDDGPADALNRALAYATGDLIGILPADDLYAPFALRRAAARMREPDAPRWLVGGWLTLDGADRPIHQAAPRDAATPAEYLRSGAGGLPAAAVFYRTDLLQRFGGFDRTLHHHWATELHCRLLAAGVRPTLLPDVLGLHRVHADSLTGRDPRTARRELTHVTDRYRAAPAPTRPARARKRNAA